MAKRTKATREDDNGSTKESNEVIRLFARDFKSLAGEHSIDVRPLTILAGANSSGKSSMMQPLLLLKQTLEAPYDPGPLLLNGPILRLNDAGPLFSVFAPRQGERGFSIGLDLGQTGRIESLFAKSRGRPLEVRRTRYGEEGHAVDADPNAIVSPDKLRGILPWDETIRFDVAIHPAPGTLEVGVRRFKCFRVITYTKKMCQISLVYSICLAQRLIKRSILF